MKHSHSHTRYFVINMPYWMDCFILFLFFICMYKLSRVDADKRMASLMWLSFLFFFSINPK